MKNKKLILIMFLLFLNLQQESIKAAGFDEAAAKQLVDSFITPLTNTALWLIPTATALSCFIMFLFYIGKDEDEKQQKPFGKAVKKIIGWAVFVWCIPAILKIFGIA